MVGSTRVVVLVLAMFMVATAVVPAAAATDFDGDGFDELVAGANGDRVGDTNPDAGSVSVLYGSRRGVSARNQRWHRDRRGVRGVAVGSNDPTGEERHRFGDQFGSAVAGGDFDGDGHDDLVAMSTGNPAHSGYPRQKAGHHVLYGAAKGLRARRSQFWNPDSPGVKGRGIVATAAVGDFNGDGFADLLYQSSKRAPHGSSYRHIPALRVLRGSPRGLTAKRDVLIASDDPGIKGSPWMTGATVGDFDHDGRDDVAVAGRDALSVFYGSSRGLSRRQQTLRPGSHGIPNRGQPYLLMLGAGQLDGRGGDDLVIASQDPAYPDTSERYVDVLRGTRRARGFGAGTVVTFRTVDLPGREVRPTNWGGYVVADFDGGGRDDLMLGLWDCRESEPPSSGPPSPLRPAPESTCGEVLFVLPSTAGGPQVDGAQRIETWDGPFHNPMSWAGISAGDHNGDGRADLTVLDIRDERTGAVILPGTRTGGVSVDRAQRWDTSRDGIRGDGSWTSLPR